MPLADTLVAQPIQRRSEPGTFPALVEQYKRPLYALAYDLTGNHHDAEDLSQEVFIKAYRGMDGFRGEAQVYSWLYRIAVNTFLNKRRKKALRFRQLWDDFSQRPSDADPNPETDRQAEAEVIRGHVETALRQLSPRERTAFVLRHFEQLSNAEAAAPGAGSRGAPCATARTASPPRRPAPDRRPPRVPGTPRRPSAPAG